MSADITGPLNRASKIFFFVFWGFFAAFIGIFSFAFDKDSSDKERKFNQESRIHYLRFPPPCGAEINAGKVLQFEDGERICQQRRRSADGMNIHGKWWWLHMDSPDDIVYWKPPLRRPNVPIIDEPGSTFEHQSTDDEPSQIFGDESIDDEPLWAPHYNGREWMNDPFDGWGNGR